jgi:hypothetical protein
MESLFCSYLIVKLPVLNNFPAKNPSCSLNVCWVILLHSAKISSFRWKSVTYKVDDLSRIVECRIVDAQQMDISKLSPLSQGPLSGKAHHHLDLVFWREKKTFINYFLHSFKTLNGTSRMGFSIMKNVDWSK